MLFPAFWGNIPHNCKRGNKRRIKTQIFSFSRIFAFHIGTLKMKVKPNSKWALVHGCEKTCHRLFKCLGESRIALVVFITMNLFRIFCSRPFPVFQGNIPHNCKLRKTRVVSNTQLFSKEN